MIEFYTYNANFNQLATKHLVNGKTFVQVIWNGLLVPRYLISDYGDLYDWYRKRYLSLSKDKDGYLRATIVIPTIGSKTIRINRLVCMSFYPFMDNRDYSKYVANHKNNDRLNNHLSNLEWCTSIENTRHAWKYGYNTNKGENHPLCIYKDDTIHEICNYINSGLRNCEICNMMNVHEHSERMRLSAIISGIRYGKTRLDISSQYDFMNDGQRKNYSEELAYLLCEILNDGNVYTYKEIMDLLQIPNDERIHFRNFILRILDNSTFKNISAKYNNLTKPVEYKTTQGYLY